MNRTYSLHKTKGYRTKNKQLKELLRSCNKMFLILGYKKQTANLRDEIVLATAEENNRVKEEKYNGR